MEFKPLLPNTEFLRDGEQEEFFQTPMESTDVPLTPGYIRMGRGVKIGRNVKFKPTGT